MIALTLQVGESSTVPLRSASKGERMTAKWRKVIVMLMACAVAGAFSAPAFSAPLHPKPKCNAGNGNASETDPSNDCDPGNSVKNKGGD